MTADVFHVQQTLPPKRSESIASNKSDNADFLPVDYSHHHAGGSAESTRRSSFVSVRGNYNSAAGIGSSSINVGFNTPPPTRVFTFSPPPPPPPLSSMPSTAGNVGHGHRTPHKTPLTGKNYPASGSSTASPWKAGSNEYTVYVTDRGSRGGVPVTTVQLPSSVRKSPSPSKKSPIRI